MRKRVVGAALVLVLVSVVRAGAADPMGMPAMKSSPGFDQLKSLAGSWQGQSSDGKAVKASYQVVSSGTCVMETLDTPEGASMITMYHMAGNKLVMDHYCAMNNVPHMNAAASTDGKNLDFAFASVTNLAKPTDMHMHRLKVGFEDADHFNQEWTLRTNGKDQPVVFHFQRAK